MNRAFLRHVPLVFCAAWLLAGCSPQGGAPAPTAEQQQAQAQSADAARNLDTYRQLLRIRNDEMAVSMGKDIVKRFPDSAAAKEVLQTLPAIEQRYTAASEKNRLAGLWLYQVAPMAGGTQSTASIQNSQPASGERVRLVLRRHTEWGQSVFLYGSKPGFVCRGNCTIAGEVDGKPVRIKAFAPSTGEPALMIRDDNGFLAMLRKAKKITLNVTLVEGEKKQSLVYEVGGFDPAKWVAVGKPKKK
ncbi:hypothetical protein RHOFW104T7_14470 [Rhodanobacter thiooxydans]|uniref:Lipoprotein n=1 Tax=Rhodanobacter thiooxydans TaxID=416169 RepID=A0A154QG75_9GAMM|nr:hypothetical protein [Rhodanobacter thiooxydans]EIL97693.1 hypothetical protein UUA_14269 [Rhodanobacter thiooxydans LCS2]KZC23239.1 hypothetical protein RHOFW104T7_14470 [Rhodanobacter thiooxydans]MCW0203932.1 hypothetical protein [Rhodanobacter thiooxydans]